MTTVLCTNGLQSKALAVVRSLGSRGVRVLAGEKERLHTSGYSKYANKCLLYPNPTLHPQQFHEWCLETIQREQCDVFMPMDDDVLDIVVPRIKEYRALCHVPAPSQSSYEVAADKSKTIQLAKNLGVPHPETFAPQLSNSMLDRQIVANLVKNFEFPVTIKPRSSSGGRGIRFAHNVDDFVMQFLEVHQIHPNPLIQEFIPSGPKYDVCLCYGPDSVLNASFVQREIRNYPLHRGPSTVRTSVVNKELLRESIKLMSALPWYGVVDVEFMIDPRTNQPKLMEINPRFWSSLQLAVHAGVDFPYLLYQLAMGQSPAPVHEYHEGVTGRSLFPGDILHFLSNSNRFKMDPAFFSGQLVDDIFSLRDFGPTVGFALSAARHLFDKKAWNLVVNR